MVFSIKNITVSEDVYKKIGSFGRKDETYNEILERLCNTAQEVQSAQSLLNTQDTVEVNDLEW